MRDEIAAAVVFITRLIKGQTKGMTAEQVSAFSDKLSSIMLEKFKNHWYAEDPMKGQGYRCIRINESAATDPMLEQAAIDSGLKYRDLKLPVELTLWIDPAEVTCRFGESIGSHFPIAEFGAETKENHANTINIEGLIEKQNEARNKIICRLQTRTPNTSQTGNKPNNKSPHSSPNNKSRNNNNHKAKQSTPQKQQHKFTPKAGSILTGGPHVTKKSDRFHWVPKSTETLVKS